MPYHWRDGRHTRHTRSAFPPRPLPATYWVVPGRLLVGEHPGSQSRADTMDRLRRFLVAGVTCFVDLTEPGELPSYEALLPFATPDGRRVEYLREPIRDHGVPAGPEIVQRVIAMIDDALDTGHVVYLHCRAGIGRSATVAGCWLATSGGEASNDPLAQLQVLWQQSERSRGWPVVPETDEQAQFVREWAARATRPGASRGAVPNVVLPVADRIRGMLLGLALGDSTGESLRAGPARPRRLDAAHGARAVPGGEPARHGRQRRARPDGALPALAARRPSQRAGTAGAGDTRRRARDRHLAMAWPAAWRARTTRAIAARQPCRAW